MVLARRLFSIGLIAHLLASTMGAANAFDPNTFEDGFMPETCFTDHPWWDNTSMRTSEFTHAVTKWEEAVTNLGITHHPSTSFDCPHGAYVEIGWQSRIGGSFAQTGYSFSGNSSINIYFAQEDAEGDPFPWSFDPNGAPVLDFRGVAVHELGHAIGLQHPEDQDTYPYKSWDGDKPSLQTGETLGDLARTPEQDDIAGGYWSKSRQWVVYPEMGSDALPFWTAVNGNLTSCDTSYACLNTPNGSYSHAFYTIRLTVDGKASRSTPRVTVTWERGSGANGHLKIGIRTRTVNPGDPPGTWGSWTAISNSPACYDNSSTWVTCSHTFSFAETQVRDVQLYVYNNTDGLIRLERVEAVDGT